MSHYVAIRSNSYAFVTIYALLHTCVYLLLLLTYVSSAVVCCAYSVRPALTTAIAGVTP
jgi:hypothetical protein